MNNEISLLKELAVVSVVDAEWQMIRAPLQLHIRRPGFVELLTAMGAQLDLIADFVVQTLQPFTRLDTLEAFSSGFAEVASHYQQNYLAEASRPRHYADQAFEYFIEIQKSKEFNTGYPLLKHSFDRLDFFIDKYITNDAWVLMSIDTVMKRLSRWLNEIADLRKVDDEDAFLIYHGVVRTMARYLELMQAEVSHEV